MITRTAVGTPDDGPYALALDHAGDLWTTLVRSGRLARVDAAGGVDVVDPGTPGSQPTQLAVAPDGTLWCTRFGDDRLVALPDDHPHGLLRHDDTLHVATDSGDVVAWS